MFCQSNWAAALLLGALLPCAARAIEPTVLEPLPHGPVHHSAVWSPDGRWLITREVEYWQGGEELKSLWRRLIVWDTKESKARCELEGSAGTEWTSLQITRDGKRLAAVSSSKTIRQWDLPEGGRVPVDFSRHVNDFADQRVLVSPGLDLVAASDPQGDIRVWRMPQGELAGKMVGFEGRAQVFGMTLSGDGKHLAIAVNGLRIYAMPSLEQRALVKRENFELPRMAFSPNGKMLFFLGYSGDRLWRAYDVEQGKMYQGQLTGSVFSHHGWTGKEDHIYLYSPSEAFRIINVKTGAVYRKLEIPGDAPLVIVASPVDSRIALVNFRELRLWDFETNDVRVLARGDQR